MNTNAPATSTPPTQRMGAHVAATDSRFSRMYRGMLAGAGVAALLLVSAPASAATAPALGTNSTHAIVSSTFTNTTPTSVTGDLCYTTAPATAATLTGTLTVPCPAARGTDQASALATLNGQACTSLGGGAVALNTINVGLGAGIFPPGCYSSGGGMSVAAGTVTLSGAGVYVFRPGGTLTTANNTNVSMFGGACEADVFWAPNGATTLGANTTFKGSILDGVANAITVGSTTSISGRLLSFGGTVTTDTDTITRPTCVTSYAIPIPTLSEWAMITFAFLIVGFGLYMQRRRRIF